MGALSTNTTADGSFISRFGFGKMGSALYTDRPLKHQSSRSVATRQTNNGNKGLWFRMAYGYDAQSPHRRHGGAWQGFKSFIVRFPTKMSISSSPLVGLKKLTARGLIAQLLSRICLPSPQPLEDREPKVTRPQADEFYCSLPKAQPTRTFSHQRKREISPTAPNSIGRTTCLSLPSHNLLKRIIERNERERAASYRYMLNDLGMTYSAL
jgi:hypothetical protein